VEENIKNLLDKVNLTAEQIADAGYFGGRESVYRQLFILIEDKRDLDDEVAVKVLEWALDQLQ
jgi:hypothetical protein